MGYFILRRGQQYGPYSQADLNLYLSGGSISLNDLARTEPMNEWLLLSQVAGNAASFSAVSNGESSTPVSQPPESGWTSSNGSQLRLMPPPGPVPEDTGDSMAPVTELEATTPLPPGGLHWAVLVLLAVISGGLFAVVWAFVQAIWVRKIDPKSRAVLYLLLALVSSLAGLAVSLVPRYMIASPIFLIAIAFVIAEAFSMRASMERYYNEVGTGELKLNGIMTFFFSVFYFQVHLHRILQERRAEELAQHPASHHDAKPA